MISEQKNQDILRQVPSISMHNGQPAPSPSRQGSLNAIKHIQEQQRNRDQSQLSRIGTVLSNQISRMDSIPMGTMQTIANLNNQNENSRILSNPRLTSFQHDKRSMTPLILTRQQIQQEQMQVLMIP